MDEIEEPKFFEEEFDNESETSGDENHWWQHREGVPAAVKNFMNNFEKEYEYAYKGKEYNGNRYNDNRYSYCVRQLQEGLCTTCPAARWHGSAYLFQCYCNQFHSHTASVGTYIFSDKKERDKFDDMVAFPMPDKTGGCMGREEAEIVAALDEKDDNDEN